MIEKGIVASDARASRPRPRIIGTFRENFRRDGSFAARASTDRSVEIGQDRRSSSRESECSDLTVVNRKFAKLPRLLIGHRRCRSRARVRKRRTRAARANRVACDKTLQKLLTNPSGFSLSSFFFYYKHPRNVRRRRSLVRERLLHPL